MGSSTHTMESVNSLLIANGINIEMVLGQCHDQTGYTVDHTLCRYKMLYTGKHMMHIQGRRHP